MMSNKTVSSLSQTACEHVGSTGYLKEPGHIAGVLLAAGRLPPAAFVEQAQVGLDDACAMNAEGSSFPAANTSEQDAMRDRDDDSSSRDRDDNGDDYDTGESELS